MVKSTMAHKKYFEVIGNRITSVTKGKIRSITMGKSILW